MRMGYNSNVVAASRTLGFNQFGVAPGISFYHKWGLYADYTGIEQRIWSSILPDCSFRRLYGRANQMVVADGRIQSVLVRRHRRR